MPSHKPRANGRPFDDEPPARDPDDVVQLQVRMTFAMHERLRRRAFRENRGLAATVRLLLAQGLKGERAGPVARYPLPGEHLTSPAKLKPKPKRKPARRPAIEAREAAQ